MPQIVSWQPTPEQAHDHITQALVLLDAHELTAEERANLLPVIVNLLADLVYAVVDPRIRYTAE